MNKPTWSGQDHSEFYPPKIGDRYIHDDFHDDFDAVIMAIEGTDNYDVSMWWLEAIRITAHHLELEDEVSDVISYLSDAIHRFHPNIVEEKWNNRIIK